MQRHILLDIDDCESNPCQNGATCADGIASYACTCVKGYLGDNCEIDEDNCHPNPCNNGGTCTDGVDSFTCDCADGWTGDTCNESKYPSID